MHRALMYHKKTNQPTTTTKNGKQLNLNRYSNCKINIYFLKKKNKNNKAHTYTHTKQQQKKSTIKLISIFAIGQEANRKR